MLLVDVCKYIDKAIQTFYRHGPKDAINVLFYSVLWIIIHAVVHEYIWEVQNYV